MKKERNTEHCPCCGTYQWNAGVNWQSFQVKQCLKCRLRVIEEKKSVGEKLRKVVSMVAMYKNWHFALLDRLRLLPRRPQIYYLRKYNVSFVVQSHTYDVQVINEIWIDKIYTPWALGLQENWVVMDFGAHRGIFSTLAARSARFVYAVEANPEAAAYCRANLAINGLLDKVSLLEGAIASHDGQTEFFVPQDAGQGSLIRAGVDKRKILVQKINVESVFENIERVDLLKCDIEGGEYDIFLNSRTERWLPKVQRIAMEYHGAVEDLCQVLQHFGFQIVVRPRRNLLYAYRSKGGTSRK